MNITHNTTDSQLLSIAKQQAQKTLFSGASIGHEWHGIHSIIAITSESRQQMMNTYVAHRDQVKDVMQLSTQYPFVATYALAPCLDRDKRVEEALAVLANDYYATLQATAQELRQAELLKLQELDRIEKHRKKAIKQLQGAIQASKPIPRKSTSSTVRPN